MERKNWLSSWISAEALELQEQLWEESAAFFRNFKIKEALGLEGFENLIFEASFAQCLARKRIEKEHLIYPLLKFIPQKFYSSGDIFQRTRASLEINVLEYIDEYQQSIKNSEGKEEKDSKAIVLTAHLLSSVYLENIGKSKEELKQTILATIKRSPLKKRTVQE